MRLVALFRDMPIRRKLTFIAVLSAGVALLFVALISITYQWFLFRAELVKATTSQATIVGANSMSALLFNDSKSANQTLDALGAFSNIEFAMLYDKQGKLFAMFLPAGQKPPRQSYPLYEEPHIYTATYLDVFQPIILEGERIGTIHVRSSLVQVYQQIVWSALIVVAAALGGLGLALMLISYVHLAITGPMEKLVGVMGRISKEKNYGLRAEFYGRDEVGTLAGAFNDMLERVQERDAELARYREHLEQEVAQRTARLTEAQRIAHLGNWEWDIVNNTLDWSDEIYRIFGLTQQQFGGTYDAFLSAVHPEDRQLVETRIREAVELGHPYSVDHRILLPDGSVRYVYEQAEVFFANDGRPLRMFGTVRDITEHKLAEEKIRQLNEELEIKVQERTKQLQDAQEELVRSEKLAVLGQVAGSVGHELRNPLGVMSNAVYFLQTMLSDADETTKEYLNIIKSEIAGSERIVSDLLDSVRTKPPHPETVGVAELIEQTLHKYTVPSSVTVKLDIPATLPPLQVDAMQIQQVFRNLISNGVEAMPEGGTLEIHAVENKQDGTVTISVRDSGIGMAPEVLVKLFQPLFTTKARGIGLGLVVVKNLTQANGGSVKVESEIGKGSLFTVTLPAATLPDLTGI